MPDQQLPIDLEDDEKVIETIKPRMVIYLVKNFPTYFLLAFFFMYIPFIGIFDSNNVPGMIGAIQPILELAIVIGVIYTTLTYFQYKAWVTSKRVIGTTGALGNTTISIPIESISDVLLNRGIIDRLLGTGALTVSPLAGDMYGISLIPLAILAYVPMARGGGGSYKPQFVYIQSIPLSDAQRIQKEIIDLSNKAKKK